MGLSNRIPTGTKFRAPYRALVLLFSLLLLPSLWPRSPWIAMTGCSAIDAPTYYVQANTPVMALQGTSPVDDQVGFYFTSTGSSKVNVTITNDSGGWLTFTGCGSPCSTGTLSVATPNAFVTTHYSTNSLAPGTYVATITATDNGNCKRPDGAAATCVKETLQIVLTIAIGPPAYLMPVITQFIAVGGTSPTDSQIGLSLTSTAYSQVNVDMTNDSGGWLTFTGCGSPCSAGTLSVATPNAFLTAHFATNNLAPGTYVATITAMDALNCRDTNGAAATCATQTAQIALTIIPLHSSPLTFTWTPGPSPGNVDHYCVYTSKPNGDAPITTLAGCTPAGSGTSVLQLNSVLGNVGDMIRVYVVPYGYTGLAGWSSQSDLVLIQ